MRVICINDKSNSFNGMLLSGFTKDKEYEAEQSELYNNCFKIKNDLKDFVHENKGRFEMIN